ncbi:MAG: hypothetical protein ACRDN9_11560 [Streptosporangiaceae bacterium]
MTESDCARAVERLQGELAELGVSRTYRSVSGDMSVLSVWYDLVVWCREGRFLWRAGPDFTTAASYPADDPAGAAERVYERYQELREIP